VFLAAGTLTLVGATVRKMLSDASTRHSEPPSGEESRSRKTETLRSAQSDK